MRLLDQIKLGKKVWLGLTTKEKTAVAVNTAGVVVGATAVAVLTYKTAVAFGTHKVLALGASACMTPLGASAGALSTAVAQKQFNEFVSKRNSK